MELHEYGAYVAEELTTAQNINIKKAQNQQKKMYNQHARPSNFTVIENILILCLNQHKGPERIVGYVARDYHGPYQVIKLTTNNAHSIKVDKTQK